MYVYTQKHISRSSPQTLATMNCSRLAVLAMMLAMAWAGPSVLSKVRLGEFDLCGFCNPGACPAVGGCEGGITWDPCGCCETCSKTLGEECGGPYGAYGTCGLGLRCMRDARECPYLFHPQQTGNQECREYLRHAMGRCVQEKHLSFMKGR